MKLQDSYKYLLNNNYKIRNKIYEKQIFINVSYLFK